MFDWSINYHKPPSTILLDFKQTPFDAANYKACRCVASHEDTSEEKIPQSPSRLIQRGVGDFIRARRTLTVWASEQVCVNKPLCGTTEEFGHVYILVFGKDVCVHNSVWTLLTSFHAKKWLLRICVLVCKSDKYFKFNKNNWPQRVFCVAKWCVEVKRGP